MIEITDDLRQILLERKIDDSTAEKIIDDIFKMWGGLALYFPKNKRTTNKAKVIADYLDGASIPSLVRKYDITENWVYSIIKGIQK